MTEIKCPACKIEMHLVQAKRHYQENNPIIIDQCSNCGGIWFDENEVYGIKHGEAEKLELLDINKFKEYISIETEKLLCPHDSQELVILKDKFFPSSIEVEICKTCFGFWFNVGEFHAFQSQRQELMSRPAKIKDEELDKMIKEYLELHKQNKEYDLIGTIGKVLGSSPYTEACPLEEDYEMQKRIRGLANAMVNVLYSLSQKNYKIN